MRRKDKRQDETRLKERKGAHRCVKTHFVSCFFLLASSFCLLFSVLPHFLAPQRPAWSRLRSPGAKVCLRTCKVCRKKVIETM